MYEMRIRKENTMSAARYLLLIDGGQEGLYLSEKKAKAGARRFLRSGEKIRWVKNGDGLKAEAR